MATTNWAELMASAETAPSSFEPLPPGKYQVEVETAENKSTQKGKDMYKLGLKVIEGEYANRKVWTNIVISPESPMALSIAFRHFAALGADASFFATNPDGPTVCAKIIGARATATVAIQKDDPRYNEVKDLAAPAGGDPLAPSAPAPAPAPAAPPADPFS